MFMSDMTESTESMIKVQDENVALYLHVLDSDPVCLQVVNGLLVQIPQCVLTAVKVLLPTMCEYLF